MALILFLSVTTFQTAFPEKLSKYSGIWELDILKFPGYHMNKSNKPERIIIIKKEGFSEPDSIWVPGQSVMMHTLTHTLYKYISSTYWMALCMCPLHL